MLEDLRDAFVECLPSDDTCVDIHDLPSGETAFSLLHVMDMKEDIADQGNLYILIVGSACDSDISNWRFEGGHLPSEILAEHHITRLYDKRVNFIEAYLIAYDYMPKKGTDITTKMVADKLTGNKTCTKFTRTV